MMYELNLEQLLREHQTPFYLFDLGRVHQRVLFLQTVLPKNVSLCYAMKANPFLVRTLSDDVERIEICSPGEYEICRRADVPPEKYVISGIYKEANWIEGLVQNQSSHMIYTVESMQQYELLYASAQRYEKKIRILLRLTSGNQFGLEREQIEMILTRHMDDPYLYIHGIQYFSGTQKTSLKRLKQEVNQLDQWLMHLEHDQDITIQELEFGPGFPVSYFGEEDEEVPFLTEAAQILEEMRYSGKITLELGRSLVAGCGRYFTRVVDQKTNCAQRYAIVDGGMHHLVYYGQNLAMRRPRITVYPAHRGGDIQRWNICGALCTINDILIKQLPVCNLQTGDVLIFENTGAYCMTEGISLFLSRALPKVLLLLNDGRILAAREATATWQLNAPPIGLI